MNWLNTITAGSMQAEFRLPHEDELREQSVTSALAQHLPDSVTSAWTQPPQDAAIPGLWIRPGQPHPHQVSGDMIRRAIILDASGTETLIQILTVSAFSVACGLAHTHTRALAHTHDPDPDPDRAVDLDRALALALARDLAPVFAHGVGYG